ncbi:MAG: DUF364 domain-containing protein [Pseudomonadota bacterium]
MTAITDRYVALAERIAAGLGSPRVRALHLPPKSAACDKDAEFCALELDDGSIGFSYVRIGAVEALLRGRHETSAFAGMEAVALARGYSCADPGVRALAFAAINALSQQLFSRANWPPPAAENSFGGIAPLSGEHIGMIGLFPPLVAQMRKSRARLTVLELRAELAGAREDYRVTLDPVELGSCDKVLSTCTVMLNDTLDSVLSSCRKARHIAIIGPSAGCVPDPLFAYGVDSIGGRRVTDVEGFRDAFCSGNKWGDYAYKYSIAREDYPGVDRLLQQLSTRH